MINAVSLFSCIGVAEYYLKDIGVKILLASDIDANRCAVYKFFYPETEVVAGDITLNETKNKIISFLCNQKIDLLIATPPCQGMSSVGKNRNDKDLDGDKRNALILETFEIIDKLNPKYIIFENVPRLLKVKFWYKNEYRPILNILNDRYGSEYEIKTNIFNAADYQVPQIRERVIIRLFKKGLVWPEPKPNKNWITVYDAIGDLPPLEPGQSSNIKNHWARKHPCNQVEWMRHTPSGCSAFNNEDHYPVKKDGNPIKGFKNCYKRIEWDKPSPTITMRNEIISSQENVHPGRRMDDGTWSDPRVLTFRELLILMSLPPDIDLPEFVSDSALRQYIGEGVPSKLMMNIVAQITNENK